MHDEAQNKALPAHPLLTADDAGKLHEALAA